mgnify:FL=1
MTKTNKKQKNLSNPVELQEHLSHRIGNVGEVQVNKAYAVGDTMRYDGKAVKVVEVLEGKVHVKNQQEPFDSFLISRAELDFMETPSVGMEVLKDDTAPDLMVRVDKSISL